MAEAMSTMTETPESPVQSLNRFLEGLPLGGRNGIFVAVVAAILALTAIIWFATRPSYKVLFSGLPEDEAGRVVAQLGKMNIPYELTAGGSNIKIPEDKVYDTRLEMATMGMPKKGVGVGFEIFDETNLVGMTDFMQRMNYQRALQGELARSVESIEQVHSARVHLVLPKRSLFVSEEKEASASVVVELSSRLKSTQIDGIVHLIASSVEGLEESGVTLLDHKGNLIAGGKESPKDGRLPADETMALQKRIEKSLEDRAQAMLDKVIGVAASGISKSIVRITAELDLSRVERKEEIFDPEGQVARSEQTTAEASKGQFGAGGVPGVRPNDANDDGVAGGAGSAQSRDVERETVNYEISKTVNHILLPVGTIKRLSVAVLVDGTYQATEDGSPPVYQPRTDAEMEQLKKIIVQAVGFRTDRGDTIQVTNAPFESLPLPAVDKGMTAEEFLKTYWLQLVIGLITLALLFMVVRPLVDKLLAPEKTPDSSGVPLSVANLEAQLAAEGVGTLPTEGPVRVKIPDRNIQMTQQMIAEHLEESREILQAWLAQDD
ncbi:MAG: flagellar M-ring protein FliF [Magnetococcales bacterium]|nr:flagellar M-ring protein FliF [Magnetococcales bacterium]